MNPFDLRGPEFLMFYLVFATGVIVFAAYFRRMKEAGPAPKMDLDPYTIAYLRGGKNEAVRVAMVSLIDRGLLSTRENKVVCAAHANPASVRHPIEKVLLERFALPREAHDVFKDTSLDSVCLPFQLTLAEHDLLPGPSVKAGRRTVFFAAIALLIGVGGSKLLVALARGRHNIFFLCVLIVVASIVAAVVCFPRVTSRGKAMLEDLRALYAGLKSRASQIQPGGATIDAVMLAAVFGLALLPATGFGYTRTLFPRATTSSSSSGCGSSYGSSCGSSCGGGGGGGGCGGCGS